MDDTRRIVLVDFPASVGSTTMTAPLIRYQYSNHIESAALELDDSGNVISYEEHYAFGGTSYYAVESSIEVPSKRYRYSAKERDEETGLYYFGARYHAPWLCRFISVDPKAVEFIHQSSYVFADNDPVGKVDVNGEGGEVTVKVEPEGKTIATVEMKIYIYSDDPNISVEELDKFRTTLQDELNCRLNPLDENSNKLTIKAIKPKFDVNGNPVDGARRVTRAELDVKVTVEVIQGGPTKAAKEAEKTTLYNSNYYLVHRLPGQVDNSSTNGNSGYLNMENDSRIWAHEILHNLGWVVAKDQYGTHVEDFSDFLFAIDPFSNGPGAPDDVKNPPEYTKSVVASWPGWQKYPTKTVQAWDLNRINNLQPLENKRGIGWSGEESKYSAIFSTKDKLTPIYSR